MRKSKHYMVRGYSAMKIEQDILFKCATLGQLDEHPN
jgi:hypothetical protein